MHDAGPQLAADAAQVGDLVQQTVHDRLALPARSRVHREPSRLVDHEQRGILK